MVEVVEDVVVEEELEVALEMMVEVKEVDKS